MTTTADNEHTRTTEEAVDWFVANRSDGAAPDDDERRRFKGWLEASPQHVEEYFAVARLAGDLTQAAQPDVPLEVLIARARADKDDDGTTGQVLPFTARARSTVPRAARPRWLPAALAAGLCAVAAGLGWWHFDRVADSGITELRLATLHGEQLTHRMEDGSLLRLNTDTAARVLYSAGRREVVLERGQMLFEVAHDTARPFAVIAGSTEVVAVGTAFEVFLKGDVTQVTVTEGRVKVASYGTGAAFEPVFVAAGEQLSVRQGQVLSAPAKVDAVRATAWIQRRIVFEGWPLAAVVAEFNRYGDKPIEVASPELGRRPIDGNFLIDGFDAFVVYLRGLEGVRVEVATDRVVVTGR
jgi:transmembrane sensor